MKRLKAMPEDDASSDSQHQADSRANLASTEFTPAALDALAAIDAAQTAQIPLALKFGEAALGPSRASDPTMAVISPVANRTAPARPLGHGKFRPWCAEVLRRSPTWCAAHLFACTGNAESWKWRSPGWRPATTAGRMCIPSSDCSESSAKGGRRSGTAMSKQQEPSGRRDEV
jgi:hypothetical protein